ncbi:Scy1 protein kinase, partial [Globisporangium splendens]
MFNKFSSVVSSAVSTAVSGAVQGVLGEEFSKHYETPKDCTASGGHELSWKIFPAVSRKNGQEVSIFVFDKDDLKKLKHKEHQERYLEVLRQEMKTLRLLRHPHVLKVEEVFEESRRTLSFVTERVTCSLANACKNFTNVANVTPEVLEIGLTEFEVACGFMHVGEALSFLHREGRRVHLSLGPHSIFITPKGEWKLGGMGFCRVVEPGQTSRSEYYATDSPTGTKNPTTGMIEGSWEPPLEYCAPELVTEPRLFNSSADMFSLGLLVYELFVPPRADGGRNPVLDVRDGNKMTHGYKTQSLHPITFPSSIPVSLHNTIRTLLSLQPTQRPEARMFLASQFFDSGPIKTLRTLQSLVEQDPASQAKFLTTLPDAIDGFSPRVLRDMVIPGLQAVVINKAVAPFVITPLLKIVAKVDKHIFNQSIAPMMIPLLAMTEPVQCMLMFVSEMEILIPKAEDGYIRDHIVPMLCRALDSTVPEILDTVLNKIVDQASLFEYRILKQVILPRVNKLILQPPQMSVRVNALLWMAKSFHVFDKDLLIESVLPTLAQTLQADKSPAVCMCILGCYDNLGKHLGPEFVAKLIIPAVAPLLWEATLNNAQFDMVCEKIQDMLKAVIQERDKVFMSESSVNSVSTGVTAASGFSEAIRAAEASRERETGVSAANKMLAEEYVPEKKPESKKSGGFESKKPEPYSDDPFYLGSRRTSSARSEPAAAPASTPDRSETFSSRRRAAKKSSTRSSRREKDDGNADLLNIGAAQSSNAGGSNGLLDMNGMSSGLPAAPTAPNDLFSGMSLGGAAPAPAYQNQNTMSFQGNSNPMGGNGMANAYNPSMMQMTPYGLSSQPAAPQQQYMSSSGGFGQQGNSMMGSSNGMGNGMGMNGGSGLAGPGQMLQIQAAPTYNPYQQQQQSSDPFSAFDGL